MTIAIKSIPTLEGKEARAFVKKAKKSEAKRGSVDFTRQYKVVCSILKKAKL